VDPKTCNPTGEILDLGCGWKEKGHMGSKINFFDSGSKLIYF
jgi:hypothetical protein